MTEECKFYINGVPLCTEYNELEMLSVYYKNRKWYAYCGKNNFAIAKKRKLAIKKMEKPNVIYAINDCTDTICLGSDNLPSLYGEATFKMWG